MPQNSFNAEALYDYIAAEVERTFNLELSRRDFIKLVSGGALGSIAAGLSAQKANAQGNSLGDASLFTTDTLPNGIAVGDVTQSSAVLWTRSTVLGTVSFELFDEADNLISTQQVDVVDRMIPAKVALTDLLANVSYHYRVSDATGSKLEGRFRTPADSGSVGLRFGATGDWRGELRPYVGVANIPERDLDFLALLGDSVYADRPTAAVPLRQARELADFRTKHEEVYSNRFGKNYWAAVRASTSLLMSIDDHEVSDDFAGGASPSGGTFYAENDENYVNQLPIFQNAIQSFTEYNPIRFDSYQNTGDPRTENQLKLYRYQRYGTDAAVFVLDARSFRDASVDSIFNIFSREERARWQNDVWQAGRTMLGQAQLNELKRDLLDAHQRGIRWKFLMMPEPVQQMGWFAGEDRWEGYAPERTEVLQFIQENAIQNVVFVSADVHSSFINSLTYQTEANGDLIATDMWEISTGSVGFYPSTGQAVMELARRLGILLPYEIEAYENSNIPEKDALLENLFNRIVFTSQGLRTLGLADERIKYERLSGSWLIGHTFGWTEFEIAPETQVLTVTTWGVPTYSPDDLATNPDIYINQTPQIMGQMWIQPK